MDYTRIDWACLKLPNGYSVKVHTDDSLDIRKGEWVLAELNVYYPKWRILSGPPLAESKELVDAAELVDAFLLEQTQPKPPSVTPPEGYAWENDRGWKLIRTTEKDVSTVRIPEAQHRRDAMLACVEAWDAEHPVAHENPFWVRDGMVTEFHGSNPSARYAVTLRRLPR